MRKYATYALVAAASAAVILVPPWLAWGEARQQAFDIEAGQVRAYAHDVAHRADNTVRQAAEGMRQLEPSGHAPCAPQTQALMRHIDLASTYIQAVGYARDGRIVCSSVGADAFSLGPSTFVTSRGVTLYEHVELAGSVNSPLLAVSRNGFVVLVHKDLPIDASTTEPDVALGLLHLETRRATVARGNIDPAWIGHLGNANESVFIENGRMVSLVRARASLVVAAVSVPLSSVDARAAGLAERIVPAALLGGLLAAGLILFIARRHMSLESALRQGLRRKEFTLLFQPIVELGSGAWVGAEALIRWRRPDGELVSPDLFIPVAERSRLIVELTDCVFTMIAHDTGRYLAEHPEFHIAINLSAEDIHSPSIVGKLEHLIDRCGAKPSNFIVEITERGLVNLDTARSVLRELDARRIEVAIDDFGTGYSSLSYLEKLRVNYLKIDRSFIEAIGTGAPTREVVGHIIEMARTMRLRMIAEGIESEAQADFLRAKGVEFTQGWLFAKPMPFDELLRRMREREPVGQAMV